MLRMKLFILLLLLLPSYPAMAEEVLRVLSWPGYVTREAVRVFETQHKVRVELVEVGSDEELWKHASANEGRDFDLLAVNTAELQRYISARLVAPLRQSAIPNTNKQLTRFRRLESIPGLAVDGQFWGIPYTYSAMGLIFNRKLVPSPPTSMSALWDARHKGRILLYNGAAHAFSFAALTLGIRDPFRLSNEQFERTLRHLLALRSNDPRLYSKPEEVVEQMREREIALVFGNYGDQQLQLLRQAGLDVGYVIPREGALAWLDCWAIMRQTEHRKLAEAWINFMLTPMVSGQLVEHQGLASTLRESSPASMHASDKLVWLQPVEDIAKRAHYWERWLAGALYAPR